MVRTGKGNDMSDRCHAYIPNNWQTKKCDAPATHHLADGETHVASYCDRCFELVRDHMMWSGYRHKSLVRVIGLLKSHQALSDEGWGLVLSEIRSSPEFFSEVLECSTWVDPESDAP